MNRQEGYQLELEQQERDREDALVRLYAGRGTRADLTLMIQASGLRASAEQIAARSHQEAA